MDTSEEYTKMCREAKEIQKIWEPKCGDFVAEKKWGGWEILVLGDMLYEGCRKIAKLIIEDEIDIFYAFENPVWLPRQDQLQEMVLQLFEFKPWKLVNSFSFWICEFGYSYNPTKLPVDIFETFEQLWLAFVMWKLYGKVWNNKTLKWEVKK